MGARGAVRAGHHRLRRSLTAAVVVVLLAAGSTTVAVVNKADRDARTTDPAASLAVDHPARVVPTTPGRPGGLPAPYRGGRWPHSFTAAFPAGVLPGHGRPSPRVLTVAQERSHLGSLPAGWGAKVDTVESGGRERSYIVEAPLIVTSRAHSLPVYLALHGRDQNPDIMAHMTRLAADTGPAVLVFPAGYEDSWNAGDCCGYAHADDVNDVAFIHTVIERVLADYPSASPADVYAIGFSNGGRMTYRLACQLPGTLAGIAAVEAVPVVDCRRLHPLDVEIIAQRDDPLLSIDASSPRKVMDGRVEPTVDDAVGDWRALDDCAGRGVTTSDGDATQRTWACGAGTRLQYTLYPGGGHEWPRAAHDRPGGTDVVLGLFGVRHDPV